MYSMGIGLSGVLYVFYGYRFKRSSLCILWV